MSRPYGVHATEWLTCYPEERAYTLSLAESYCRATDATSPRFYALRQIPLGSGTDMRRARGNGLRIVPLRSALGKWGYCRDHDPARPLNRARTGLLFVKNIARALIIKPTSQRQRSIKAIVRWPEVPRKFGKRSSRLGFSIGKVSKWPRRDGRGGFFVRL